MQAMMSKRVKAQQEKIFRRPEDSGLALAEASCLLQEAEPHTAQSYYFDIVDIWPAGLPWSGAKELQRYRDCAAVNIAARRGTYALLETDPARAALAEGLEAFLASEVR